MKVRFEEGAIADLPSIFERIALDKPTAAARLLERIEHIVALLATQPDMGRKTKRPTVRTFPVVNYLIVYEVTSEEIIIQYVRHGARVRPWEGE